VKEGLDSLTPKTSKEKTMKFKQLLGTGLTLGLMVLVVMISQAQGPDDPDGEESLWPGDGGMQPLGELAVAETVSSTFSYQGVLKEDGQPVTGNREMIFRLYSNDTCTQTVGSPMTYTVPVNDGLFNVSLLVDRLDFSGQALWLETEVDGTSVGCQTIQAVPYALSLRPGAIISGTVPYSSDPYGGAVVKLLNDNGRGLYVETSSNGYGAYINQRGGADALRVHGEGGDGIHITAADDGIIANGGSTNSGNWGGSFYGWNGLYTRAYTGTGVHGESDSATGYAGVFRNNGGGVDIAAAGSGIITSVADSYVFVPGNAMVKNISSDTTRWDVSGGTVQVWRGSTAGPKSVYLPVTIPAVLYGQSVTIKSITVYYKCQDGTQNFITRTGLVKMIDADTETGLIDDYTDRQSNTATSYTLTPFASNVLSSDQGILGLYLTLDFANDTNYVQIAGARIQIGH
jgi:hypothetical protein